MLIQIQWMFHELVGEIKSSSVDSFAEVVLKLKRPPTPT